MQRQRSALTEDFQRHKPGLTSRRERESDNDLCRDLCEQRLPCGFAFHVFHHYTHLPSVPVSQRKSKLGRLAFSTHIAGFGMESCLPAPTTTEHDNTRHHIILLARCGQCHGCQWKCFRSLRSSEKLLRCCGALGRRFRAPLSPGRHLLVFQWHHCAHLFVYIAGSGLKHLGRKGQASSGVLLDLEDHVEVS